MDTNLAETVLNISQSIQIYVKMNGTDHKVKLNLGGREIEKVEELFELL